MGDKVVESVVESALALKKIAIENAKTELMNELSPRITDLFNKRLNEHSKKLVEQMEDDEEVDVSVSGGSGEEGGKDEAEIDLDDLSKELEGEEGAEGESVEDKVDVAVDKLDAVADKIDAVAGTLDVVKDKVAPEEAEAGGEGGEEDLEIEDDTAEKEEGETEGEELGEAVDIDVHNDDVRVNVFRDEQPSFGGGDEDEYVDIVDDEGEMGEGGDEESPEDIEEDLMKKESRKMSHLRDRIREQKFEDPTDPDEDCEELVDIEDDTDWNEAEAPAKVDWSKHVPKLEHKINVLQRALKRASTIIATERRQMKRVGEVLKETKLLNEKLVLVNRIFAKYDLPKDKKYKVLEAFDKATTSRESVTVYETLLEHFNQKKVPMKEVKGATVPAKVAKLQEGIKKDLPAKEEKKPVGQDLLLEIMRPTGALPQDRIVDMGRMKQLAGIKD